MIEPTVAEVESLKDERYDTPERAWEIKQFLCDFWLAHQAEIELRSVGNVSTYIVPPIDKHQKRSPPPPAQLLTPATSDNDSELRERQRRDLIANGFPDIGPMPVAKRVEAVTLSADDAELCKRLRAIVAEAALDMNDGLGPGGYVVHAADQDGKDIAQAVDRIEALSAELATQRAHHEQRDDLNYRKWIAAEARALAAERALREWRDDAGFDNLAADGKLCDFIDTLAAAPAGGKHD